MVLTASIVLNPLRQNLLDTTEGRHRSRPSLRVIIRNARARVGLLERLAQDGRLPVAKRGFGALHQCPKRGALAIKAALFRASAFTPAVLFATSTISPVMVAVTES
jgi:hypothetical protein